MSHRHKRKWPVPQADLILDMHFQVQHPFSRVYHAEVMVTIPVKNGFEYYGIGVTMHTERAALRALIERVENSFWFQHLRSHEVRFKVTGCLEATYRGYL